MSTAVATKPAKVSPKTSTNVKNAVGINGDNQKRHVLLIQNLLNRNLHLLPKIYPLTENGKNSPATEQAILSFQAIVVKTGQIDGRVDISGATHKLLLKNARRKRAAHVQKFIDLLLKHAQKSHKKYKLSVSFIIAQSAVESEWGKTAPGNAYFGIKQGNSKGPTVTFTTHEYVDKNGKKTKVKIKDKFRSYKSLAAAADDHGEFLTTVKHYRAALPLRNQPYKYAAAISKKYATKPAYGILLKSILKINYLTDYDRTHLIKGKP